MRLHAEGRFEEMWEMLAEDAQRAWGSVQNFIREMPRLDQWLEILEMQVASEALLETWTDHIHQRTYNNVARLVMRYRVRQQWREWTFDRQVHLIPAAGSWRTLCYPTRARAAAGR
jgi:phage-related minor tail protein